MLGRRRRLALLAEGSFTPVDAKTAVGVLRYRSEEVVAVIDSARTGMTARECAGVGGDVPVVASLEQAVGLGADGLLIGVAPQGGRLPDAWRATVRDALERGLDVLAGLHEFLADDPELAAVARRSGASLIDVRRPPAERRVGARRAAEVRAQVVLTVGSDCNVGKMTTALELQRELQARGVRAAFVATGQTGIFVADSGVAVDAVPADFIAGAVETAVLEAARDSEVVIVEGQGALHHPGFSGVTLGLMHGVCPRWLVLCHRVGRERMRTGPSIEGPPIPPLAEVREANERAAAWVRPAATLAVALNTADLGETEARAACAAVERELRLPATDPIRFGVAPLAAALEAAFERDAATADGRAEEGRR